ncbi:MAG: STAS domain-containing protein [Bacteroidales bacterium]
MNTFQIINDKLICQLEDRLDTISCQKLEWDLDMRITENQKYIVFDLAQTEYISSSFLRICIRMLNLIGHERFSVIHVNQNVMQVFAMANLTEICTPV